jgi:hypothetical protein
LPAGGETPLTLVIRDGCYTSIHHQALARAFNSKYPHTNSITAVKIINDNIPRLAMADAKSLTLLRGSFDPKPDIICDIAQFRPEHPATYSLNWTPYAVYSTDWPITAFDVTKDLACFVVRRKDDYAIYCAGPGTDCQLFCVKPHIKNVAISNDGRIAYTMPLACRSCGMVKVGDVEIVGVTPTGEFGARMEWRGEDLAIDVPSEFTSNEVWTFDGNEVVRETKEWEWLQHPQRGTTFRVEINHDPKTQLITYV